MAAIHFFSTVLIKKRVKIMRKNKKNKIPQIKKEIKVFLMEEEGSISKKSIINTGLALVLLTAFMGSQMRDASAFFHGSSGNHTNYQWAHGSSGVHTSSNPGEHCQHQSHGSHGSHDAHASGGWC